MEVVSGQIPPMNAVKRVVRASGINGEAAFTPASGFSAASGHHSQAPTKFWINDNALERDTVAVCELRPLFNFPDEATGVSLRISVSAPDGSPTGLGGAVKSFPTTCIVSLPTLRTVGDTDKPGTKHIQDVIIKEWKLNRSSTVNETDISLRTIMNIASVISPGTNGDPPRLFLGLRFVGCSDSSGRHRIQSISVKYVSTLAPDSQPKGNNVVAGKENFYSSQQAQKQGTALCTVGGTGLNDSNFHDVEVSIHCSPILTTGKQHQSQSGSQTPRSSNKAHPGGSYTPRLAAATTVIDMSEGRREERGSVSPPEPNYDKLLFIDDAASPGALCEPAPAAPTPHRTVPPSSGAVFPLQMHLPTNGNVSACDRSTIEVIMDNTPQSVMHPTTPRMAPLTPRCDDSDIVECIETPQVFSENRVEHSIATVSLTASEEPEESLPNEAATENFHRERAFVHQQSTSNVSFQQKDDVDLSPLSDAPVSQHPPAARSSCIPENVTKSTSNDSLLGTTDSFHNAAHRPSWMHSNSAPLVTTTPDTPRQRIPVRQIILSPPAALPTCSALIRVSALPPQPTDPTQEPKKELPMQLQCSVPPVEERTVIPAVPHVPVPCRSNFIAVARVQPSKSVDDESAEEAVQSHLRPRTPPFLSTEDRREGKTSETRESRTASMIQAVPNFDASSTLLNEVESAVRESGLNYRAQSSASTAASLPDPSGASSRSKSPSIEPAPLQSQRFCPTSTKLRPQSRPTTPTTRDVSCLATNPPPVVSRGTSVSQARCADVERVPADPVKQSAICWCTKHHATSVGTGQRLLVIHLLASGRVAMQLRGTNGQRVKLPFGTDLVELDEIGPSGLRVSTVYVLLNPSDVRVNAGLDAFSDGSMHISYVKCASRCLTISAKGKCIAAVELWSQKDIDEITAILPPREKTVHIAH